MATSKYNTPCQSPSSASLDSTTIDFSLNDANSELLQENNNVIPSSASIKSTITSSTLRDGSSVQDCRRKSSQSNVNVVDKPQIIRKLLSDVSSDLAEMHLLEQQFGLMRLKMKSFREGISLKMDEISHYLDQVVQVKSANTQTETPPDSGTSSNYLTPSNITPTPSGTLSFVETNSQQNSLQIPDKRNEAYSAVNLAKVKYIQALFRGYLTRRLLKTEKVQDIIKTIRDTIKILESYEIDSKASNVTKDDLILHRRLMVQLESSIYNFHEVIFDYSKVQQMSLITRSREILMERSFRNSSNDTLTHENRIKTSSKISTKSPAIRKQRLKKDRFKASNRYSTTRTDSSFSGSQIADITLTSTGKSSNTDRKSISGVNREPVRKSQRLMKSKKITLRKSTPGTKPWK